MFPADELSASSVSWSVVNTAGLEEMVRLSFKADSSVAEAEPSGLKCVSDLLVRALLLSLT